MKKVTFLCCLFCGLITQAIGATYDCKLQHLGLLDQRFSLASRLSNEYLFMNVHDWKEKIALVCGHRSTYGCRHGTIVVVEGEHYHKNLPQDERRARIYKCDTIGGGSWEVVSPPAADIKECSSTKGMTRVKGNISNGAYYLYTPMSTVKYHSSGKTSYAVIENPCFVWDGDDDLSPVTSEEEKADTTKDSEKKSEQGTEQTESSDAGKKERKRLEPCWPEDLPPHATAGHYVYINAQKPVGCAATECEEGYYLVRNAEGQSQGWCDKVKTTNTSETTSEQGASSSDASGAGTTGADTSGADATGTGTSGAGATGAGATEAGTSTQTQSGGGASEQVQPTAPKVKKSPCELGQSGWRWFEGRCITDRQYQNILAERQAAKVRALTQKIESTASQLDSMSSKFKVSVWKDAEGKFNTARLASDSIAGVVLGTAGGLITSHVVKKNQVENGFQDIKCTIGGQSVANWGDEFSVGIQ